MQKEKKEAGVAQNETQLDVICMFAWTNAKKREGKKSMKFLPVKCDSRPAYGPAPPLSGLTYSDICI